MHHRNVWPEDPHLRLWCGLVTAAEGDDVTAIAEFRAAAALGLGDDRPVRYEEMLVCGWPRPVQWTAKPP